MDPFTPNDPVWKLLGRARPVEPRTDFAQTVMRAARNTPQQKGWWPHLQATLGAWLASLQRPALIAAAALVVATMAAVWFEQPAENVAVVQVPAQNTIQTVADDDLALIADDLDIPLEGLNHMDALVAMDDTSSLTDTEIAFLLY